MLEHVHIISSPLDKVPAIHLNHISLQIPLQNSLSAAPILRLPPDILVAVFAISDDLTHDESYLKRVISARKPFPFIASHVCAEWRCVAITNPLLWTRLHVVPPWSYELVDLWHTRSRQCLIDFHLTAVDKLLYRSQSDGQSDDWDRTCHRALLGLARFYERAVAPHITKYRSISIHTGDSDQLANIGWFFLKKFREFPDTVPALRALTLQIHDTISDDEGSEGVLFPRGAPALIQVLMGSPFSIPRGTCLGLTRLHINLQHLFSKRLHETLSESPALQTLVLYNHFQYDASPNFDDLPPLQLASLSSIQLYGAGTLSSFQLLQFFSSGLHAPELRHILVAPVNGGQLAKFLSSGGFQSQSFPALEAVTIGLNESEGRKEEEHILMLHRCFPDVVQATLVGRGLRRGLGALKRTGEDGLLVWPKLRTLGLRGCHLGHFKKGEVRGLAASRAKAGAPLNKVVLDQKSLGCMTGEDMMWLREHVEMEEDDEWQRLRWAAGVHDVEMPKSIVDLDRD